LAVDGIGIFRIEDEAFKASGRRSCSNPGCSAICTLKDPPNGSSVQRIGVSRVDCQHRTLLPDTTEYPVIRGVRLPSLTASVLFRISGVGLA
jgi:hypothetical protein